MMTENILNTPLTQNHIDDGAKMAPFAGYNMPLYYADGALKEHLWVRDHAGLFDVSHMGQVIISGEKAMDLFHHITPTPFEKAPHGRAKYTVLLNEDGGIIDDMIVTKMHETCFFVVVNAGRKHIDIPYMEKHLPEGCRLDVLDDRALIALQGPAAQEVLKQTLDIDASDHPYMFFKTIGDAPVDEKLYISRLGYTGEDGFEISVPEGQAAALWTKILSHDEAKPIGLAARDSLRLEMGYPLYGHDLDEKTSPVEAALSWVVSKKRDGYLGYDRIQKQLQDGPDRVRVGIKITDRGIAREGAEIQSEDGTVIGTLTSGGHSPSLSSAIGQGYVKPAFATEGTKVNVIVRGKPLAAEVSGLSFIQAKTVSAKLAA